MAEQCKAPEPTNEHTWLRQLAGEWSSDVEMAMGPGQPMVTSKGSDTGRMIGDHWILIEHKGTPPGMDTPFTGLMTLGFDPEKKKFVGTWIDSMSAWLWKYEGTLDPTGRHLTLDTEGPNPMFPGKLYKYRESIEVKGRDGKVFSSSMQLDDGEWVKFMTATSRRAK